MKTIRTAGTGAPFVVVRDLNEYRVSKRKQRRIARKLRKCLKALDNQTY